MRLHSLEIQAFGPFAATASVDIDTLSAAGLFLLSGATGSGKTSVLDAVCFALYGDVPGDRSNAKRLRSDQAAPGLAPRVTLEATLSGRRFRFVRSPQWERAKKRGTGTTTEQASVVVSERMRGQWVTLSTRLDEAGHLVTGLVGMTMTQFTQVAMLPQGRFQTFLRSRSDERHRLLQQLFRTGRFEDVERWLRDHRLELRRQAAQAHQVVADVVSRVSEAAEADLDPDWDLHDLAGPLAEGSVTRWVGQQLRLAAERSDTATRSVDAAVPIETATRAAHAAAVVRLERLARHRRALADRDALAEQADEHQADGAALAAARRAAPVLPQLRVVDTTAAALARAGRAWADARTVVPPSLDTGGDITRDGDRDRTSAALRHHHAVSGESAAAARALRPRVTTLHRLDAEVSGLGQRRQDLRTRLAGLDQRVADLPGLIAAGESAVDVAVAADRELLVLRPRREQVLVRLEARHVVDTLSVEVGTATEALTDAHAQCLAARESWLSAREARLDAMAAEIAGVLAVGDSCPVCGSSDHPHKAAPAPGAVGAEAEHEARRRLDDAQAVAYAHESRVRELIQRRDAASIVAGDLDAAVLSTALGDLDQLLEQAGARAEGLDAHRADLAALISERESLARTASEAEVDLAGLDTRSAALVEQADAVRVEVAAMLADTGHDDLDHLIAHLDDIVFRLGTATRALADLARSEEASEESALGLCELIAAAGFADRAETVAAALPADQLDRLSDAVADHQRRLTSVETVLADFVDDPDPDAAPDSGADEGLSGLKSLAAAHTSALDALSDARGLAGRATASRVRLTNLSRSFDLAVAAWTPLAADLALAARLSAFAEGKSADNRLQMRLSAYVLAHRLSQVVAAANERLSQMSDQRYALEHTAERGAGETRGGLSLLVRDDWSGEARDPATLSGGETFVVSLALALGLADVITHEAGGADLDTLFVDEGFGSLDADTLDDVMDVLDTLRDGGRVVAVVSHVAEMRDRIPTRLLVAKSRTGSTLSQVP